MELVVAKEQEPKGFQETGRIELRLQFVELRAKGWSLRKIERKLKVSKSALANWDRELEEEIASLKAIEQDANLVIGLYNESVEQAEEQEPVQSREVDLKVTVLKQKGGVAGRSRTLSFDRPVLRIKDKQTIDSSVY